MQETNPPQEPRQDSDRPPWRELGLAHDINALLGIILGRCQLLLQKTDDPEVRRQVGHIVTAARDAADHAREILDGGQRRPDPAAPVTRIALVLQECRELIRFRQNPAATVATAAISFDCDVPAEFAVRCPPADLRRVLINLIDNALAAMPDGGRLQIHARARGHEVVLEIADSGAGMDEAALEHIFEPGHTKGKSLGRGLGLAIAREIVTRQGGRIEVASQPGQGTRFTLHFPRPAESAGTAPETEPGGEASATRATSLRILIVDNETSVREFLAEVLAEEGHVVTLATAAPEVLTDFQPGKLDLVLADLSLPGLDGLELARELRHRDARVAIVVISGWSSRLLQEAARDTSVDVTATKPLDVIQLRQLVAQAAGILVARQARADASRG